MRTFIDWTFWHTEAKHLVKQLNQIIK